jgi:hypothetical protein
MVSSSLSWVISIMQNRIPPQLFGTWLATGILLILGSLNLFHPLLNGEWVLEPGDSRWNMYLLEHRFKVLTDRNYPGSYATAPFWIPDNRNNLASSDLMAGAEPFYFVPRLFLSRDSAYQTFLVLAAFLNFASFTLLVTECGAGRPVALGAATLFAYGAHRVQHLEHSQFALQLWGVLAVWCWLKLWRTQRPWYLFGLVLTLGLHAATSAYAGYFLVLGLAVWSLVWGGLDWPGVVRLWASLRQHLPSWAGAAAGGVFVPVLLLTPYWHEYGTGVIRNWGSVNTYIPKPVFWLRPLQGTAWWHFVHWLYPALSLNECHFLGFAAWLAVLVGLWQFAKTAEARADVRMRLAVSALLSACFMFFLVTRWIPGVPPLWRLCYLALPWASGMRDIRRISLAANLLVLVAAALFVKVIMERGAPRRWLWSLAALAAVENITPWVHHLPRDWYAIPTNEIREILRGSRSAAGYLDPALSDFKHPDLAFNFTMQLVGQELNVPVINGPDLAFNLPGYPSVLTPFEVGEKKDRLDRQGFVYLVPRVKEEELTAALRQNGFVWQKSRRTFSVYVLAETGHFHAAGEDHTSALLLCSKSKQTDVGSARAVSLH